MSQQLTEAQRKVVSFVLRSSLQGVVTRADMDARAPHILRSLLRNKVLFIDDNQRVRIPRDQMRSVLLQCARDALPEVVND